MKENLIINAHVRKSITLKGFKKFKKKNGNLHLMYFRMLSL